MRDTKHLQSNSEKLAQTNKEKIYNQINDDEEILKGDDKELKELVKETRGLLREVIKLVRESRKSNRG